MTRTKRRLIRTGLTIAAGIGTLVLVRAIVLALERAGIPLVDWLARLLGGFLDVEVLAWLIPGVFAVGGAVGFVLWQKFLDKDGAAPKLTVRKTPRSLVELFRADFPETLKLSGEVNTTTADGAKSTYLQQVYQHFDTNTEFAGFYIPRSPTAFNLMAWLASNYRDQYDKLKSEIQVSMKSPLDLTTVVGDTLTFTGRVYVYHEDDLTLRQIADLADLYAANGMHLMLRGPAYATQSWMQERLATAS